MVLTIRCDDPATRKSLVRQLVRYAWDAELIRLARCREVLLVDLLGMGAGTGEWDGTNTIPLPDALPDSKAGSWHVIYRNDMVA